MEGAAGRLSAWMAERPKVAGDLERAIAVVMAELDAQSAAAAQPRASGGDHA